MKRLAASIVAFFVHVSASAAQEAFGPFVYDPGIPNAIILSGVIDDRSALEFRRAIKAHPDTKFLALHSPGGSVSNGLLIADDVQERGLVTYIPSGFECSSACSFIFFAGTARLAEGRLGVHQVKGGPSDMVSTQLAVSDIAAALGRYGVSSEVLAIMLRTPPDSMYYFSPAELQQYGLNRDAPPSANTGSQMALAPTPSQTVEERAVSFLAEVLVAHSSATPETVGNLTRYYADDLGYYGRKASVGKVVADKRAYFQRWPERSIRIRPDTVSVNCADLLCHITGLYDWSVRRADQQKAGAASFSYMINLDGSMRITAEGGQVVR